MSERPDGLSQREHGVWRQLVEAALTAAATPTNDAARAVKRAAHAAHQARLPGGPSYHAALALVREARAFAGSAPTARREGTTHLRALAVRADELLGEPDPEAYVRPAPPPRKDLEA